MKIGCIVPDRGDRNKLKSHCEFLLFNQTVQPDVIAWMDYEPESHQKDITQRYRRGYDKLRGLGLDVIFLIENDEFYAPNYIETQLNAWNNCNRPDLFGTNYTIYFHLRERAHFTMYHDTRSSAMSTLIKPDLNFKWCPDHEPYTDTHLWMASGLKGVVWSPPSVITLGIKHGTGLCGGSFHTSRMHTYKEGRSKQDPELKWLGSVVDPVSLEFYRTYFDSNFH